MVSVSSSCYLIAQLRTDKPNFPLDMEAMKINFQVYGSDLFVPEAKYAIRVFIGGVNGLSGEPVKANMATVLKRLNGIERTQDYLYVRGGDNPAQQWLDGVSIAPGIVRQFVAAQPLSSETIEHQITGLATVGGIQIEIIPQLQLGRFQLMRRDHHHQICNIMASVPGQSGNTRRDSSPPQTLKSRCKRVYMLGRVGGLLGKGRFSTS